MAPDSGRSEARVASIDLIRGVVMVLMDIGFPAGTSASFHGRRHQGEA